MPRFFFDVHERHTVVPDEAGLEFQNAAAAEREAVKAAGEIARNLLAEGDTQKVCVELRDEHRSPLAAVTVSVEIKRPRRSG